MDMMLEIKVFAAYAAGMLLVYAAGRWLLKPLKGALLLVLSSVAGGILLFAINWMGGSAGVFIPVNPLTTLITGALGIPGIIMMLVWF